MFSIKAFPFSLDYQEIGNLDLLVRVSGLCAGRECTANIKEPPTSEYLGNSYNLNCTMDIFNKCGSFVPWLAFLLRLQLYWAGTGGIFALLRSSGTL